MYSDTFSHCCFFCFHFRYDLFLCLIVVGISRRFFPYYSSNDYHNRFVFHDSNYILIPSDYKSFLKTNEFVFYVKKNIGNGTYATKIVFIPMFYSTYLFYSSIAFLSYRYTNKSSIISSILLPL